MDVKNINILLDKRPEYPKAVRRSPEKESLAKEISEITEDTASLGAYRAIADKLPEQQIRRFLAIVKDTHLSGKIKKSKGAMFITLARGYAHKNSINLKFK